jgi:hypothetical protein
MQNKNDRLPPSSLSAFVYAMWLFNAVAPSSGVFLSFVIITTVIYKNNSFWCFN